MRRLLPALLTAIALLALPAVASAAAPTSSTQAPTSLYSFSATLNANVDPNAGPNTTVVFRYGTDPLLLAAGTQVTASQPVAANGAYNATVTGLTPGTPYYVRAEATNDHGTDALDAPVSFATFPVQVATTDSAASITSSSASLNATADPNGLPTQARFIWGTSPSQLTHFTAAASTVHLTGSTAQPVAIGLTGLPANTTIYYQVRTDREPPIVENAILGPPVRSFKTDRALTGISASGVRTKFGSTGTVTGVVSGAGTDGVTVVAEIQRYPFTEAFRVVASAKTTSGGRYSIKLPALYSKTRVRVSTAGTAFFLSPQSTINVEPTVGLMVRRQGSKRVFYGSVRPRLGANARVSIQRKSGWRWITVRTLKLTDLGTTRSRYSTTLAKRSRPTSYRVQVRPNQPDLATGASRTRSLG